MLVEWIQSGGRKLVVDDEQDARPRPWISVYPCKNHPGLFAVCWMCSDDSGYLVKRIKTDRQRRKFVAAHRRCGFALEPTPHSISF